MDPEQRLNKIFLPNKEQAKVYDKRSIHQGRHYISIEKELEREMTVTLEKGRKDNWMSEQYKAALDNIIYEERQALRSGDRALNKNKRDWAK